MLKRAGQERHVGFQPPAGDAVDLQGPQVEAQAFDDPDEGGPGDEGEVDGLGQLFQIDVGQVFQPEGEAEGVEFFLPVAAVDRGDVHGDVAFVVDILLGLEGFRALDGFLELLQGVEQGLQALEGVADLQIAQQLLHLRKAAVGGKMQLMPDLLHPQVVLLVAEPVHLDQQGEAADLFGLESLLGGQPGVAAAVVPGQQLLDLLDGAVGSAPGASGCGGRPQMAPGSSPP